MSTNLVERVRKARQLQGIAPMAQTPSITAAARSAANVPGGWFGGWLGVSPWWQYGAPGGVGAHGIPGVTDGSDAAPGMVGEWLLFRQTVVYPVGNLVNQPVTMGALPAGDWDCQAYGWPESAVQDLQFGLLAPIPDGFSDTMGVITSAGGHDELAVLVSYTARALIAQPVVIAFEVNVTSGAASNLILTFTARRMR